MVAFSKRSRYLSSLFFRASSAHLRSVTSRTIPRTYATPLSSSLFRLTSASKGVPSYWQCFHSKYWGSPRKASLIFWIAFSLELFPSGWKGGENPYGDCPTICSRVHPNMFKAIVLQSTNWRSFTRNMPSPAHSKRVRYRDSLSWSASSAFLCSLSVLSNSAIRRRASASSWTSFSLAISSSPILLPSNGID
ncbi:MAG: hypothetical protein A4E63_02173 [Syntrophorhabdus sp. PtaU1.Bin050]|nr:MAG: hypothetical protein A4E63_02173 [Syntrophorhabdus sp. PtaU1.Bin050]